MNGKISSQVVFTYRLQPIRTGSLTIPAITIQVGKKTLYAASFSVPALKPGKAVALPLKARANERARPVRQIAQQRSQTL